ncbi:MAG: hypothetical protein AAF909_03095 [Pseudomonadota bacterium]
MAQFRIERLRSRLWGALLCACVIAQGAPRAGAEIWVLDARGTVYVAEEAGPELGAAGGSDPALAMREALQLGSQLTDIAFGPDGRLYGVSSTELFEVDLGDGALRPIAPHGAPCGNALEIDGAGVAHVMGCSSTFLLRLDSKTGAPLGAVQIGYASSGDLAFHGDRGLLLTALAPEGDLGGDFGGDRGGDDRLVAIDIGEGRGAVGARDLGSIGRVGVYGLAVSDRWGVVMGVGRTLIALGDAGDQTPLGEFDGAPIFGLAVRRGLADVALVKTAPTQPLARF